MKKNLQNKKIADLFAMAILLLASVVFVFTPAAVLAQTSGSGSSSGSGGLSVNFGTPPSLIVCGTAATHPCGFSDLITLANAIITWLIWISIPLALVGISYGGWLYMTDSGNESKIDDAKKIFKGLMWGFIWLLVAYALVYTIVNPLLNTSAGFQLFKLG